MTQTFINLEVGEEELVVKDALTGNDKQKKKKKTEIGVIGFTEKKIKCIMEIC